MIGCDCGVCRSADPRDKRYRCSLYVEGPGGSFLVDTTPDLRSQALRAGLTRVNAVVYTHAHMDHVTGFDDLRAFCRHNPGGEMPVHGSEETLEVLQRMFAYAFNGHNRFVGYVHPVARPESGPFEVCGVTVTPFEVPHGRVRTWGFRFDVNGSPRLAYASDAKELPPASRELVRGVPVLVLDALRHEPHPTHLTLGEAIEVARDVRPDAAWFTHITHLLPHAATEATLPEGMRLAYDTLVLDL